MLNKIKKILKYSIIIISILIIIINITLIIKSEMNQDEIPDFLGFTPFIIVSGSMEPKLPVDDIIITRKVNKENIKVGDVISYWDEQNNIVITHRVVNIQTIDGKYFYETKGDNNNSNDKELVEYSNIQGKLLFGIPIIGKVINYVREPKGMAISLTFIIAIYALYSVVILEITRNKHKNRIGIRYKAYQK